MSPDDSLFLDDHGADELGSNSSSSSRDIYRSSPTSSDEERALESFRYRTFACPHCHTYISVRREDMGKKVLCPDCELEVEVPRYLDFDTPTDYERQYFDRQKRDRDKLLSPLTNPNREGLNLGGTDVYSLNTGAAPKVDTTVYYPIRCRVCETLMQVTQDMLGQMITCPDCGTKTIATDALKRQQETVDVSFQPRERGLYDIGAIPETPPVFVQRANGKSLLIDPSKKTIAPTVKVPVDPRKKRKQEAETSYDDLSFVHPVSIPETTHTENESGIRRRKKKSRKEKEENLTEYLPKMVLRRKNGEMVWSLPSPPKRAPLFNKTFQAALSEEIWARAGLIVILMLLMNGVFWLFISPARHVAERSSGTLAGAFAEWEIMWSILLLGPLAVVTASLMGQFFWSVFNGGNSGARRIVEWRKEEIAGFIGYGFWMIAFLACTIIPGACVVVLCKVLGSALMAGSEVQPDETLVHAFSSLVHITCFWLFFPVFWIATHQTELPFCPITSSVLRSFFTKFHIWVQFYAFTVVFFLIPSLALAFLGFSSVQTLAASFFIPVVCIFSGLMTGRLSWILDDEVRLMDFDDDWEA